MYMYFFFHLHHSQTKQKHLLYIGALKTIIGPTKCLFFIHFLHVIALIFTGQSSDPLINRRKLYEIMTSDLVRQAVNQGYSKKAISKLMERRINENCKQYQTVLLSKVFTYGVIYLHNSIY